MNNYEINRNIEHLYNYGFTFFLDGAMQKALKSKLKKKDYQIYYSYQDADKVIYYNELPKISLIEIISLNKLRHQDILGAILNLGIDSSYLGDIVINEDKYYFYILDNIKEYIFLNLNKIGNNGIKLQEIDLNYLSNYEKQYEEISIIVPSDRIDIVIARLIHTNRDNVKDKVKNKEIILNYEILNNYSKSFREGDIFSIRKYGKYQYLGVIEHTKKDNLVIKCKKYL